MHQSDVAGLKRVLMKHPRDAFVSQASIDAQWESLNYLDAPDYDGACREADTLAELLTDLGVGVEWASSTDVGMDSIYVRDASLLCDHGAILCRMGKAARSDEPSALRDVYSELGIPIVGAVEAPGTLEGGDTTWLSPTTLAVGRGYRTNAEGIRQLTLRLGSEVEVVEVPLPHWRGPCDVFHLMSMVSPLADGLLLVYAPLLPVPFVEALVERGFGLVEVPDSEFGSMGCNVLAAAPRVAVALEGNPETRARMESAGVEVHTYPGAEISTKGGGGPTCLTRPLERG